MRRAAYNYTKKLYPEERSELLVNHPENGYAAPRSVWYEGIAHQSVLGRTLTFRPNSCRHLPRSSTLPID